MSFFGQQHINRIQNNIRSNHSSNEQYNASSRSIKDDQGISQKFPQNLINNQFPQNMPLIAGTPSDPIVHRVRNPLQSSFALQNKFEENKEESELSDYVEENFQIDETDEFSEVIKKADCLQLKPHQNNIR